MRYLYKIYSHFDGFYPTRIPDRMVEGRLLTLGWARYLDAVHLGDEVWIVFTGRGFENGVYAQGLVARIDPAAGEVQLRVRRHSTTAPLTDAATSAALKAAVSIRNRQVFLWPADRELRDACHARDCAERRCHGCDVWNTLPQIETRHYRTPPALRGATVVPAYWLIPPRCFLYYNGRQPAPWVRRTTEMFQAFKVGEKRYAYPLAAGIHAALASRRLRDFEAIVSIPLSPEKAAAGELDRTAALAGELARLMPGARSRQLLSLSAPISKRRMQAQGYTATEFKQRYRQYLQLDPAIAGLRRIILLDDAITKGSTLSVAIAAIRAANPGIEIVAAAAGQMIVMDAVADQNGPAW